MRRELKRKQFKRKEKQAESVTLNTGYKKKKQRRKNSRIANIFGRWELNTASPRRIISNGCAPGTTSEAICPGNGGAAGKDLT
jgi:hypothetical protein